MSYEQRKKNLVSQIKSFDGENIRLGKETSNLFRDRVNHNRRLDVTDFQHVLSVNAETQEIETEGMVTYESLTDACLAHGLMPAVVPQLKSITIGGAVGGIGIEASSFRYGLPHETVVEMDVALSNGNIICCTPTNEHKDLFFGMANSYGTLGYILRLKIKGIPIKPFVRLTYVKFDNAGNFFLNISEACNSSCDFVDGVVFDSGQYYLVLGEFVDKAPYVSDYTYLQIYYRSIRTRNEDYLTTRDFLWRWDTDWFWCSKNLFMENKILRVLLGREKLNSITYQKIMRWNNKVGLTRRINNLLGVHRESIIQDVDIPIDNAELFLKFFIKQIGILPIWICPTFHGASSGKYPLFPMHENTMYINFGFWDGLASRHNYEPGHFNRLIESKVAELGGVKSLYSDSFYSRQEFDDFYGGSTYKILKKKYDPDELLSNLYDKCVLRQ